MHFLWIVFGYARRAARENYNLFLDRENHQLYPHLGYIPYVEREMLGRLVRGGRPSAAREIEDAVLNLVKGDPSVSVQRILRYTGMVSLTVYHV